MKVVFIIGSVSDAHIVKRIEAFIDAGYDVEVAGFTREFATTNKINGIEPLILGSLQNQQYKDRIFKLYKSVSKVIKSYPKDTLFYIWGFDIAFVAMLHKVRMVYEISDIAYASFPSFISCILRNIDRKIINSSQITILTSEGFADYLYPHGEKPNKLILLPNKLSEAILSIKRPKPQKMEGDKIRFAFMGLYRYPNTILRLARIIGDKFPSYEFHFFGIGKGSIMEQVNELCAKYPNVYEHGPFHNPTDLSTVYSKCDIIACNYDTSGVNERIAEPNKLYEAIYFCKPLLVSSNTFLSKKISQLGIGYDIESIENDCIIDFLNGLDKRDLYDKSCCEASIDARLLVEDYSELWNKLKGR